MNLNQRTIAVKLAAKRLHVSTRTLYFWSNNGCPWLEGCRLKIAANRRAFDAKLRNVASVERLVGTIACADVERIEAARTEAGATLDGLISRPDALRRFRWLTAHMLRQWTLPAVDHHRYKKGARHRSNRGNCPALGRPLQVERHVALKRGAKRESPYYRLAELEQIGVAIAAEAGRHVENGVEYKTTVRLRSDLSAKFLNPDQLAVWLPDHTYRPLKRAMLMKLQGRALARRKQRLWPVALTLLALDRRYAARRAGCRGRGRWIPRWLKEHPEVLAITLPPADNATADANGQAASEGQSAHPPKKRGRGRPARTGEEVARDFRLRRDYVAAGSPPMADFAHDRGMTRRDLVRAFSRVRTDGLRRRTN